MKILLWLILLVICWPLALLVLLFWPIIWLLSIPFRIFGIVVTGALELVRALVMLPARVLQGRGYAALRRRSRARSRSARDRWRATVLAPSGRRWRR